MHPIENIRLSQKAREQLIQLKRKTGIKHWNVLCRWAFCVSLAEPSPPPDRQIVADSNVEMTWKVFGGKNEAIYEALLLWRCRQDDFQGIDKEIVAKQFRLHLERGIAHLAGEKDLRSIGDLMEKVG